MSMRRPMSMRALGPWLLGVTLASFADAHGACWIDRERPTTTVWHPSAPATESSAPAASRSTDTTGDPGGSGSTIPVTRKCFSLCCGFTAVHLECSSFLGFNVVDRDGMAITSTGC